MALSRVRERLQPLTRWMATHWAGRVVFCPVAWAFGVVGEWKSLKVVLRHSESTSGPIVKPQWPLVFDLIDDPSRMGPDREATGLCTGFAPCRAAPP